MRGIISRRRRRMRRLDELDKILNTRYTARWEAKMGDGPGDDKELFFLNRLIRHVLDGTAWKMKTGGDSNIC